MLSVSTSTHFTQSSSTNDPLKVTILPSSLFTKPASPLSSSFLSGLSSNTQPAPSPPPQSTTTPLPKSPSKHPKPPSSQPFTGSSKFPSFSIFSSTLIETLEFPLDPTENNLAINRDTMREKEIVKTNS
ncbi:hypothetical protein HanPSC8_Chr15g0654661 [Helianthus annuus]|nr:hypothetical protein HanPSC8_Chr15g0654661 [Helianthus annuus]